MGDDGGSAGAFESFSQLIRGGDDELADLVLGRALLAGRNGTRSGRVFAACGVDKPVTSELVIEVMNAVGGFIGIEPMPITS